MTDIFFSYRSVDRERVRPIRDAFAKQGFEVFWDQEVPSGVDWDTWIRQHLTKAKCAVVFWSAASVESDNVRHEAAVAKRQSKLITVLLEPLSLDQFPMGLYSQQAINLANWKGDFDDAEWHKLNRDIEAKLTPPWMQRKVHELEAELEAERARREGVESRNRAWQAQIAKEVLAQEDLRRERNKAVDEAAALKMTVGALSRERSEIEARAADLSQRLNSAEAQRQPSLEASGSESVQAGAGAQSRQTRYAVRPSLLLYSIVAVLGVGAWTLMFLAQRSSSTPPTQTPTTIGSPSVWPQSPPGASGLFTSMNNTEAYGEEISPTAWFDTIAECEQSCRNLARCSVFTYAKSYRSCFLYSKAKLQPSVTYDTGLRK